MADSNECPISPIKTTRPELTISAAAINDEPVELDSTPASPEKTKRRNSKTGLNDPLTPEELQKRKQLISERKTNPAVMVDIPQTPGPEELERAGASGVDDGEDVAKAATS